MGYLAGRRLGDAEGRLLRLAVWAFALSAFLFSCAPFDSAPDVARAEGKVRVFNKKIIRVVSGDTILCLHRGERAFVYQGISVPTDKQLYSREATEANKRLVERNTVRIECSDADLTASMKSREGLPVPAKVYLPRSAGEDVFVNLALVERGVAVPSEEVGEGTFEHLGEMWDAVNRAKEDQQGFWGPHPDLDAIETLIGNHAYTEARGRLQQFLDSVATENIPKDLQRPLLLHIGRAELLWVEATRAIGDTPSAEEKLSDLLSKAPKMPGLWFPLGRYYKKLEVPESDPDKKLKMMEVAFTCFSNYRKDFPECKFPDCIEALREEASLAYEMMKWTVAYDAFQKLSQNVPLSLEESRKMNLCPEMVDRLTRLLAAAVNMKKADKVEEALGFLDDAFEIGGGNYKEICQLYDALDRERAKMASVRCGKHYESARDAYDAGEITQALTHLEQSFDALGDAETDSEAEASCREKADTLRRACEEEKRKWMAVYEKNEAKAFKDYLDSSPPDEYADYARERLASVDKENTAYTQAFKRNTIAAYEGVLKLYPNHPMAPKAYRRVIDLKVADFLKKKYAPIPAISVNPGAVDANELTLAVRNNRKKNVVVVYFSGPDSQQVVVDPKKTQTLKMVVGTYNVVAHVYEKNYPMLAGQQKLVKNSYTMTFDEGPPPAPIQ